jgi:hypothetical protein
METTGTPMSDVPDRGPLLILLPAAACLFAGTAGDILSAFLSFHYRAFRSVDSKTAKYLFAKNAYMMLACLAY